MSTGEVLYEGKAKIIYRTDDPDILLAQYKDDATAFNAQKRGTITNKGRINCAIATHLFKVLEATGVATHFIDQPNPDQMRMRAVQIVPLEVVVRNIAAGSLCQQTGLELGVPLSQPLVDFYYKDDALGDPLLTRDRILLLELATPEQLEQLRQLALQINQILINFFHQCGITLVDFKLEFGITSDQQLLLADEISPDTCRLWDDAESDPNRRVMDKDRFRRDLGEVDTAYARVMERVLAQDIYVP
ncbi:phosphoribosylaminoimidazolesuccinocarboxamide synthase [Acaryochloris sp. 'Moss Beach']|uniref:phosphoribosylaminoimidazolesuccinocarboxamide synthase n=1 Tax=Acaryochloris TaxID=155977 RepID=UPI001BB009D8|nr:MULTISPECIES: phosphoribosylaminoimidazolesuccinocarboxamide synthase [Acaryochloris]QUY44477.1 phosphoribosylaminoimidazolesuccinocarboxamide synthase [Acaryochloris marina S15]UJB69259.1 phosphoribosylaminoimidazolesuccinocarboxamide synthase [Acaryochloris sp. 'Moss Beach']